MDSGVTLWQFLLELLLSDRYQHLISWTSCDGEFKLLDAEAVAKLWGLRKNKTNMNYDKLSRALRYYYDKNIIKKVLGQKFVYRFVSFPDRARFQNKLPMKRKLSSMSGRAMVMELRTTSGRNMKGAQSNSHRGSSSSNDNSPKGLSQSSISVPQTHDGRHGNKKISVMGIGMGIGVEAKDRIQVKRSRSASSSSSSSSSMDPFLPSHTSPFSLLDDRVEQVTDGAGLGVGGSGVGLCGIVRDALTTLPFALDSTRMDLTQFQPWLFSAPPSITPSSSSSGSSSGPLPSSLYQLAGNGNEGLGEPTSNSSIFMPEPSHYFSHHFWLALTSRLQNFPINPAEFASLVASSTSPTFTSTLPSTSSTLSSKKSPHYLLTSLLNPGLPPELTATDTATATTTLSSSSSASSPSSASSSSQHLHLQQSFPHFHQFHSNSIHSTGSASSATSDHPHHTSSNLLSLYS